MRQRMGGDKEELKTMCPRDIQHSWPRQLITKIVAKEVRRVHLVQTACLKTLCICLTSSIREKPAFI
ncbi:hypothetical protein J6590_040688 [Homalodisca vitripennis]|nr:hypothetical protein J6590_040688 [Homalodisca vitripennis]